MSVFDPYGYLLNEAKEEPINEAKNVEYPKLGFDVTNAEFNG